MNNFYSSLLFLVVFLAVIPSTNQLHAQNAPYDVFPEAQSPNYRVRYEASTNQGELIFPVNYTIWIPPQIQQLRGVIVHQHGCGEGSCKSGLTGAFDLHWQALAKKHACALLSPAYEQPEKADCQIWCDPRNGSATSFLQCLKDLGEKSGHPELSSVPWALWGHSGGGHWCGGMVMLYPERVACAWLRSGVPLLTEDPKRTSIKSHKLIDGVFAVPIMCNLGTNEGYSNKDGRFAGVWPANQTFFQEIRSKEGLIAVAIDPLTAHECGNQRYLAIRWMDACLTARLPGKFGEALQKISTENQWLSEVGSNNIFPANNFMGDKLKSCWLINEDIAQAWKAYVTDTNIKDLTPPPAPYNLQIKNNILTWQAEADLESGLAGFIIKRDGEIIADLSKSAKNSYGRPLFQNLQYSDTPQLPLIPLSYHDQSADSNKKHNYQIISINTTGLTSE